MSRAARRIVEKLRLHGYEALFAGGWVRDYLLGRKPKDVDIATSALPDQVLRLFPKSRALGAQFGVVQVRSYGHAYEIATFRSDHDYRDGRHPASVTFSGPEQDALRRDFTINGLFFDPLSEKIIDYVQGRNDLDAGLIRSIGNPEERFSEDKLRMLRAIRFSCTLGFAIVPETWNAILKYAPEVLQVSWERIRDEMTQIITSPGPNKGLALLRDSGILKFILPEVSSMIGMVHSQNAGNELDLFSHTQRALALLKNPSAPLAWGTLLHDIGKPLAVESGNPEPLNAHPEIGAVFAEAICRRFRMSKEESDQVMNLVLLHSRFAKARELRKSDLRRLLRSPYIGDHLELHRVDRLSGQKDLDSYTFCMQKLEESKGQLFPDPLLNGEDLISMGYLPGPIFGQILRAVEDWQLEGTIHTKRDALERVRAVFPLERETT